MPIWIPLNGSHLISSSVRSILSGPWSQWAGRQQKMRNTLKFCIRKRILNLDNCQYRSARSVSQKRTFSLQLLMLSHRDAEPKIYGQYWSPVHYYIILTGAKEVFWALSYLNSPFSETIRTKLWFTGERWWAGGWYQTKHWVSRAMHSYW